jgi:hypothetical protein
LNLVFELRFFSFFIKFFVQCAFEVETYFRLINI